MTNSPALGADSLHDQGTASRRQAGITVRHEDLLVIVWTAISTMPGGPHPVTELSPTSPPSTPRPRAPARPIGCGVVGVGSAACRWRGRCGGVTVGQLNILVVVARMGPVAPRDVARRLNMEKSTVSRNVMRMRDNGWLSVAPPASGTNTHGRMFSFIPAVMKVALYPGRKVSLNQGP